MKPLQLSIQAIRSALKEETTTFSLEEAALIYAQQCAEAELRLDRVAAMMEKGSDYQALQVAEEEPALLDLVAALSFGDEKSWQGYCETQGLQVAPRLNAKIVQQLEALYGKGISANHPLYKDFRAAVLSRDDAKSLQIVRTILKLNPTDDNARKELLRLENKSLQEKIDQLREALKTDDEERIATLTEAIKAQAPAAKLERVDSFHQGEAVRVALRRRQAEEYLPELLERASTFPAQGNWRGVGNILDELNTLVKDHGLEPLPEVQVSQRQALSAYHQKEAAADEKRRAFDRCIKAFVRYVEEIETRLLTGSGVTFDEIAERDETFVKRWKELETFHLAVPNDILQRLKNAGQELRARLDRMQRGRRTKTMSLAALIVLLLGAVTAVSLHAWKAYSFTQELAGYQAKGNCGSAENLIQKLRQEEQLLLRWPYLQAKIVETESWAKNARAIENQVGTALTEIEKSFAGDASSLAPTALVKKIDNVKLLIPQLAADFAPAAQNRFKALETRRDLYLATELKHMTKDSGQAMTELEALSTAQLTHEKPAAQVAASCKDIEVKLRPLEQLLKSEVDDLNLPADLEARITAMRKRLDSYQADVTAFAKLREETAKAATLDAYKAALQKWQEIKFVEAATAIQMLDRLPTEKAFQAALFTGGDEGILQAILDDKSRYNMAPDVALESDQKALLSLMHDDNLNEIFESTVIHYSPKKPSSVVYSKGRPTEGVIGSLLKWSAKFFEPRADENGVLFIERSYSRFGDPGSYQGDAVTAIHLSKTSQCLNKLGINRMLDEKGERVVSPLLEVMDKLVREEEASPIVRAYLMTKLEYMIRLRPYEWGLHLCPSLEQDLHALHVLLGNESLRSEDWMVSSMQNKWTKPLGSFFAKCKNREYMKEAFARRNYLRAAVSAGLRFVGYVEVNGTPKLNQTGLNVDECWALGARSKKPMLVPKQAHAAPIPAADSPLPLSPIFEVRADRKQLAQKYQSTLMGEGTEFKPLPGESLYLTTP